MHAVPTAPPKDPDATSNLRGRGDGLALFSQTCFKKAGGYWGL